MNLKLLYGEDFNQEKHEKRVKELQKRFFASEKQHATHLFSSPGRAEILGNHTDHNHGKVIVSSISCDILAAVAKTNDNKIKILSEGYPGVVVDINKTAPDKKEYNTSHALVKGVVNKLLEKGYNIGGFTAYTHSGIFKGAGVSSSAAFEVLICEIFNFYYLDGKLSKLDKAKISQYAENVYFGKPCGLLDQCGISFGGMNKIDFKDTVKCSALSPVKGYRLIITNTGGDHADLTAHYGAVKSEMKSVAWYFNAQVLREVNEKAFYPEIKNLKNKFGGRAVLRAVHFFEENKRVDIAAKALASGDVKTFLSCVDGSGQSSYEYLQNCYVEGDKEQNIPVALALSKKIISDGAVRIHGGGFKGTILAFVKNEEAAEYIKQMQRVFSKENVFAASVRSVGTTVIK